jgi:glucosamine-6-phosphate deaminase
MVLHGPGKAFAARRLLELGKFDPAWPASIIFQCRHARILLDQAAALISELGVIA